MFDFVCFRHFTAYFVALIYRTVPPGQPRLRCAHMIWWYMTTTKTL